MSKEDTEMLHHGFEMLNLKTEKPKFHKIIRHPGPERLLFLQRCLYQFCGEGQAFFGFTAANSLEEQKELEEEVVKHISSLGVCKERRIITGNGSEHDNMLFWKRLLVLLQSCQSGRSRDTSSSWQKTSSFMTELFQHPQMEKVLQPQRRQLLSSIAPDNSLTEVDLQQTEIHDRRNDCNMELSVSPTLQEQERNCSSLCQRLKENLLLLQERLEEFKDASKSFPRMEAANLSCIGEAIEQQCTQLKQIRNFYSSVEKIESAVDFLTSIEPPDVTATASENLLMNNSSPDLLNELL